MVETMEIIKFGAYLMGAGLSLIPLKRAYFSEKIETEEDLLRISNEEAKKIGLDPSKKYICNFGEDNSQLQRHTACVTKEANDTYVILFYKKRDRTTVRHELYHIYGGHCDRTEEATLIRRTLDEIEAEAYALYGLKLRI